MAFVLSLMYDCGRNGTDDSLSLDDVHLEAFSPNEDDHKHHFSSELPLHATLICGLYDKITMSFLCRRTD